MAIKVHLNRKFAVAAAFSLILASCASNPKPSLDQSTMTPQQRSLSDYAGQHYVEAYAAQAGIVGAVAGGVAGCLLARAMGQSCGSGAAIGAAIGGVGGAAYGAQEGRKTEELAKRQLSAQQANSIADDELTAARSANANAAVLVQQQRAALADLRQKTSSRAVTKEQAQKAIDNAKQTELLIGGSRERLKTSIDDVQAQIRLGQAHGSVPADLIKRLKSLQDEEKKLDEALNALTNDRKSTEGAAGV